MSHTGITPPPTNTNTNTNTNTRNASHHQPHTVYRPVTPAYTPLPGTASRKTKNESAISVSERQRGNPLLQHIRAVPYEFGINITPDYIVGETNACLYLSIKYHINHPKYIQTRFDLIGKGIFTSRILLLQVDVEECSGALHELTRLSLLNEFTVLLCFSVAETARYIETFKVYEKKPADSIQEKIDQTDTSAVFADILSMVKSVNKTDATNLISQFGSFAGVCNGRLEDIALCPGFGEKKVKRLYQALHAPFISSDAPANAHFNNDPHKLSASPSPPLLPAKQPDITTPIFSSTLTAKPSPSLAPVMSAVHSTSPSLAASAHTPLTTATKTARGKRALSDKSKPSPASTSKSSSKSKQTPLTVVSTTAPVLSATTRLPKPSVPAHAVQKVSVDMTDDEILYID